MKINLKNIIAMTSVLLLAYSCGDAANNDGETTDDTVLEVDNTQLETISPADTAVIIDSSVLAE